MERSDYLRQARQFDYSRPYQETVDYIHSGFPVYLNCGRLYLYPSKGHPCHFHGDLEFLYALSGRITYSINGQYVQVRQGEGIFVNSRQLHYGFSQDGSDCEFFCIVLNPMLLAVTPYMEQQFISPLTDNPAFTHLLLQPQSPWQNRILEAMQRAWSLYRTGEPGYMLELQGCLCGIWGELFRHMPSPGADRRDADDKLNTLRDMVGYLQAHFTDRITLAQVAQVGHVCESTCCRLFQKYLHRSPMEYLTEFRLNQAVEALRDTNLSITDIAFRSGFNGASYFTEQFRKAYGCTPRQYRSQIRRKMQEAGLPLPTD